MNMNARHKKRGDAKHFFTVLVSLKMNSTFLKNVVLLVIPTENERTNESIISCISSFSIIILVIATVLILQPFRLSKHRIEQKFSLFLKTVFFSIN
ncbi:MAG: hypothetical protein A3D31_07300 [Candidatus Fluviicola riflensis]|nr:MAG: hypothetical protein CHH17_07710 [Candidatus Fluviicola riflensis]OGS79755.1 MAG: hypothetical protein A3D31_07300 [Candidatus Fluviicola riflensis]OGS87188.1 MAG: hypothetical protein A2724_06760 [Fluviicola sp. RIFCSPHIGHO2_01_FULL_43_53]OGS89976.1 MAG: hypothetical protein A3E30_03505 [Fluviicola sp. RIFCSPHIGHO2_12_FULL_43_24]